MTTEHLKASIIDCFKEKETELLLCCVMVESYHQHIYISFNDPDYITAVYEPNSRRFTQLVYGSLKIEL